MLSRPHRLSVQHGNLNACMDECPVEAIYPDMDVPDELQEWIELNEKAEDYPQLVGQLDPLKGPKCVDSNADQ